MIRLCLIFLAGLLPALRAESPLEMAARLYRAQDYSAAAAALTPVIAREPGNAAANHLMGMCLRQRGDRQARDAAKPWLEKASALAPDNPEYLADLAGDYLELAELHWSLSLAVRGRDLMEKALQLDPNDVGGREGLMRFYREAPWPLGDQAKAEAEAAAILRRDPRRGALAAVYLRRMAKDYSGALALALAALPHYPDDYRLLFEVGREAALAGAQVDAGIAALQRCQRQIPPMDAPGEAAVADRLGMLWDKKGDAAAARAAYAEARRLDPTDAAARRAAADRP